MGAMDNNTTKNGLCAHRSISSSLILPLHRFNPARCPVATQLMHVTGHESRVTQPPRYTATRHTHSPLRPLRTFATRYGTRSWAHGPTDPLRGLEVRRWRAWDQMLPPTFPKIGDNLQECQMPPARHVPGNLIPQFRRASLPAQCCCTSARQTVPPAAAS